MVDNQVKTMQHQVWKPLLMSCKELLHPMFPTCSDLTCTIYPRMLKRASGLYMTYYLVMALVKARKELKETVCSSVFWRNLSVRVVRSSFFFASFGTVYMSVMCMLRKLRAAHYQSNGLIGGFTCGLVSILMESPDRRKELNVFLCGQSLDALYRLAASRGYLPWLDHVRTEGLILGFGLAVQIYAVQNSKQASTFCRDFLHVDQTSTVSAKIEARLSMLPPLVARLLTAAVKGLSLSIPARLLFVLLTQRRLGYFIEVLQTKAVWFLPVLLLTQKLAHSLLLLLPACDVEKANVLSTFLAGYLACNLWTWHDMSMYVLTKALAALWDLGLECGYVTEPPMARELFFAAICSPLLYATTFEPHNVRPSFMNWIIRYAPDKYPVVPKAMRPTSAPLDSL
eukprot:g58467.t1